MSNNSAFHHISCYYTLLKMSVGKIILKSTTRMSLNDRFTVLRQEKPAVPGQGAPGLEERRQQAQASRRNQRLAAQMERRPAVMAALKLKKQQHLDQRLNGQRPVSVKQRLAVQGRLSVPDDGNSGQVGVRGRGGLRGVRGASFRGVTVRGGIRGTSFRGSTFRGTRGIFGLRGRGARGTNRGVRGGRFLRGRGMRGVVPTRGGVRGSLRGRGFSSVQGRGTFRGRGRGGRVSRGVRGGRGGRGAMNGQAGENCTREELDQQLDEYMSKTKNALDCELDQYMKDATME
ncbi:hypothetical protein Pmani_001688 [Petrolisthes manimaculis]|uniref:Chromatin target of PRMT1 protein C-terminal domain-containing protein n=1 Tax=Petrolisthes manimaculis TaxID=1843537 RepID=A0AAE1QMK8_9EUCA|nr:hypothetical protein Pmani_001688 [Petrolisthes manimaculis]